jgi:hypothetical protein
VLTPWNRASPFYTVMVEAYTGADLVGEGRCAGTNRGALERWTHGSKRPGYTVHVGCTACP